MSRMVGRAWSWLSGKADRQALEADLREEFAGHLGLIEQELISQGLSKDEARRAGRARFGDVERLVRDATKIKLGGSLMLQRINLVLLVVIGGAVVWLLVQNQQISARSVQTMEQVSASLVALQTRQPASAESTVPGPRPKVVYVAGLAEKPGTYQIPPGGFRLKQLIASAGGLKDGAMTVYLEHEATADQGEVLSASNMDMWPDHAMVAGDVVTISEKPDTRAPKLIKIIGRGYVSDPAMTWMCPEEDATLARVLQSSYRPEPGATSVRVERSVPEPWSTTLTISEAKAESGTGIKLHAGDIVTVMNPEADASAKEWKRYERSERIRELVRSDEQLMRLVDSRESADQIYDDYLKRGYPRGHRQLTQLREQADITEGRIMLRVSELLRDQIDRAAANDETLRGLLAERNRLQKEPLGVPGMPGSAQMVKQLEVYSANAAVLARYDELAKGQPH
jgi:hypothetical protein